MIDDSEFRAWMSDKVTKEIFKTLSEVRQSIKLAMASPDVIMDKNSEKTIARLLGQREGLDSILEICLGDITDEDASSGT